MTLPYLPLANFGSLFGIDGFVILVVGLLIFGRKLPEVGKNLGKTIVEFKKGLNGAYGDDKSAPQEDPQEDRDALPPPSRRLSAGSNAAPPTNARTRTPVRRRAQETEEV